MFYKHARTTPKIKQIKNDKISQIMHKKTPPKRSKQTEIKRGRDQTIIKTVRDQTNNANKMKKKILNKANYKCKQN